jgi:hypothetical protein
VYCSRWLKRRVVSGYETTAAFKPEGPSTTFETVGHWKASQVESVGVLQPVEALQVRLKVWALVLPPSIEKPVVQV